MRPSAASQTVALRPTVLSDDAFLRRLYASTRERELGMVAWTEEQKAAFVNMQFDAQCVYYREVYAHASFNVIELDGVAIGRLYLATSPNEVRIIDIALLPEHRGRGLGTALMHEILSTASASRRSVSIHVELDNRPDGSTSALDSSRSSRDDCIHSWNGGHPNDLSRSPRCGVQISWITKRSQVRWSGANFLPGFPHRPC